MIIVPEEVTLTGWDTQRFEVRDGARAVPAGWKIEPEQRGSITRDGIYTAPRLVWVQRTVMVIATTEPANEVVLARVTLSNSRTWVTGLFSFLGLVATALMVALLFTWPKEPATSRALAIGPSSVVLEKGETQIFVASDPVDWSAEAPKGVFTAEADAGAVQVVGTKTEGKDKAATAAIKIGPTSLTVAPPLPVLHSGESIQLHAQTKAKGATWTASICTKQGLCTAPGKLAEERIVIATVSTQKPELAASIPIRLLPDAPSSMSVLFLAMLFGGLGGLLHALNSLVAYVGSGKFVSSWGLFYLARPFVGAVMALIVFLVFKGQLSAPTLNTSDLFAVAAMSAVTGLFSDSATQKLKEIFDAILGPKSDARADKLEPETATRPVTVAAPVAKPVITNASPSALKIGPAKPLVVSGTGFDVKSKGRINGQERQTAFTSDTELVVTLDAADTAKAQSLDFTVANPNGDLSNVMVISVA